jgi:hypothetical protein
MVINDEWPDDIIRLNNMTFDEIVDEVVAESRAEEKLEAMADNLRKAVDA